ncbi:hypothetical protein ACFYOF_20835 [Streptomyces sp. NPDC007148]|uniref:hypothetical protein n=1 Tax=Streptomyces sp. NPDC007148 TaxID=3364775 RepID=UPI003698CFE0
MPRYYVSPDGGSFLTASGGPFSTPPEGWSEITPEDYETRIEAARQEAEARSAEFLANDGALPSQDGEERPPSVAPISELRKLLDEAKAGR